MAGVEIDDYDDGDDVISFNFALTGSMHHQGARVSKNWILLDNQSTADVFCTPKLLQNIRKINKVMHIKCNAGVTRTSWVGKLPGYGQVWYYKDGIANILSLSRVEEKYRISYYNAHNKKKLHHPQGQRRGTALYTIKEWPVLP
jgi:hypothetical protein